MVCCRSPPVPRPELNPTENIWEFLRQNDLSNRVFPYLRGHCRCLLRGLEQADRPNPGTHPIYCHPEYAKTVSS